MPLVKVFSTGHWTNTRKVYKCQTFILTGMDPDKALVVFQDKKIRRIWHEDEWFYSIIDVVQALTDSSNPRNYWNMLKTRELEHGIELYTICVQLKLVSSDGKYHY